MRDPNHSSLVLRMQPEIILQIVISTVSVRAACDHAVQSPISIASPLFPYRVQVRTPITQLVALVLSVLLPPLLVPSSGAIAPTAVPGRGIPEQPPQAPLPPLPCVCK